MNLTNKSDIADKHRGLTLEEIMAKKIPSNKFIACAIQTPTGYQAVFSAPGLFPDVSRDTENEPLEFDTEDEANIEAYQALLSTLNAPRERTYSKKFRFGRPIRLTGAEFAVKLRTAGVSPTQFAHVYGTKEQRVMKWIDGVEDIPHPVRILLDIFQAHPTAIDIAEESTNDCLE